MSAESVRLRPTPTRGVALSLHVPLRRLALCADCEACFDIGMPACPGCGGNSWVLLTSFLDEQRRRAPRSTTKQLLVVARDRQKLYEYARRAFAGNPSVEVVLDRRRGERRKADRPGASDRRRGDRRLMLEVEDHLRTTGWAIVRLDVFRSLGFPYQTARR